MQDQDPFADVPDEFGDAGTLGGQAFKRFAGSKRNVQPAGYQVEMCCGTCGDGHVVTLEWKEIVIASTNAPNKAPLAPDQWNVNPAEGSLFPESVRCHCGSNLKPEVTPDECRRTAGTAIARGYVPRELANQWAHEADQFRGAQVRQY